jgi:parallel beta-helix repeat protein
MWDSYIGTNIASAGVSTAGEGGGAYIRGGVVSIIDTQFVQNLSQPNHEGYGGGAHLLFVTQGEILSSTFRENHASQSTGFTSAYGGGLLLQNVSGSTVANNTFEGNTAIHSAGGGVYVVASQAHLDRNVIRNNQSDGTGGVAIYEDSVVTLTNNLIATNCSPCVTWKGTGVSVGNGLAPVPRAILVNNTIVGNGKMGINLWSHATGTLTNNIIVAHTWGITEVAPTAIAIQATRNLLWNTNDPIIGTDAIQQEPKLGFTYAPREGSPALNQGVTVPWVTTDLDGKPRPEPGGTTYDIGAYEGVRWGVGLPLVARDG